MKIVFATNNAHKLQEVREILGSGFEVVSLKELGCFDDIPETADTLQGNSLLKAEYIHTKYGCNCFADDTGLEIEALNGAPGVYSARFAGEPSNSQANRTKVLNLMSEQTNRKAQFRTVVTLILDDVVYTFDGKVEGVITTTERGDSGFGYDPIFQPDGYNKTFAELPAETKNEISHRGRAMKKFAQFLLDK